jgi:peptidoglycan/xylan/chitin deacetylase (PgdA/CDA1 family)
LAVEPYNFEGQMEYLARNLNVVSIDELKCHLETYRPFKERTVVVTFDGGYADVLYAARDVLEQFEVPATVFATTANVIEGGQVWWKALEDFLIASHSEGRLELEIDGALRGWPVATQHDRFGAYDDLYSILSGKTPAERNVIIGRLAASLSLQADELDDHRTMSAEELRTLAEGGLITIGGHTHSCVKLSSLPKWRQIEQVSRNKDILEEVLGHRIDYFSYPFGNEDAYTAETIDILRDVGFSLACGSAYGTVSAAGQRDLYELPRVKVGNWNAFAFYRFLRRFFD